MKKNTYILLLALPLKAFAWGAVGHRTVGIIADRNLTSAAKAEVSRLLNGESLGDVANWADAIKSGQGYKGQVWYHIEKIPDGVSYLDNLRQMPDWQKKKGGAVGAILVANKKLRDHGFRQSERVDALKFLVHIVGDIHQPLHSGPPFDKGGVTTPVNWFGYPSNLHKVWDSGMILTGHKDILGQMDMESTISSEKYADYLIKKFKGQSVITEMDVEGWLNETLEYRKGTYDLLNMTDQQKYLDEHLPIVDLRLYQAGLRLAAMVNAIFGNHSPPASQDKLWNDIEAITGPLLDVIRMQP